MRAAALAGALFLLPVAPALADSYPPSGVHVVTGTVSDTTVSRGQVVVFSGGGFRPGSALRISVGGVAAQVVTASASGEFTLSLVLTRGGQQVLAASGLEPNGRLRVVSAIVTVGGAGGGLPTTGDSRLVPALGTGFASVALGSGLVLVARARRRSSLST